ncbi:MAG: TonB-dependent receptor [Verrucomicrobia bacterium]|nr:TonB-dependent receptor [Verrucomicrobiota bacterium]
MSCAQSATVRAVKNEIRIAELQGAVEISPAGATTWVLTQTNQVLHPFDRLRSGVNSRGALRWSDQSILPFGASTELEILPPHSREAQFGLHLVRGIISFFHRDTPGRIRVITRGAVAGVEGTEFVMAITATNATEFTTLSVIDGRIQFGNEPATLVLTNGQQAVAELGQAPARTAGFIANNVLQWCFYYPAVLDLAELPLTSDEQRILAESIDAYRAGDLLAALAKYPATRQPDSDAERVYYAALLLGVGQVEDAEAALSSLSVVDASARPQRLATALRQLIAAVKRQTSPSIVNPELATEFLANSYHEQSRAVREISLERALNLAKQAVTISPDFGFAWERVAELEFSFGHTESALDALNKSLGLTPRNAEALALKGFLLAAQNKTREAIFWFDRALAVDGALGNAWLGRGLCRIRLGDAAGGREDLLVAAALEPQRAVLRSYLSKAYANAGDSPRATKELELAKHLDPNDPTAWLYSALLNQQNNRINEAIRDLEKSAELNDNRSVYRSQLLLDQDQAVRGANLAAMYHDAGMSDVAVREASRAVNHDYGNYSAHLFLANSYNAVRDPNLVNLRYETAALNEYLLADLLAPVSAGALTPAISQHEYSRLFERDRFGVVSSTEYLSRGAWRQSGAQYGTFENLNYSLEAFYRSDPGQRLNNDIIERQLALTMKQELSPQDSVYLRAEHFEAEGGDLAQYYRPTMASPTFRYNETHEPIVALGYHHEWSPGVHTFFFATRLDDTDSFTNQAQPTLVAFRPDVAPGVTALTGVQGITMHENLVNKLEIYSAELQQIWQQPSHNTIFGARVQYGHFETANLQNLPSTYGALFPDPPAPAAQQDITSLFRRISFYGYHQWEITDWLEMIGGLTYDRMTFPENFRTAPISAGEKTSDQVSPKAGLIWRPVPNTVARFAYARSLAGASLDQSYQLEPSQVAGFVQSFRSIIPESVAGANVGARFETYGISLEQKFSTGTYLGVSGELLNSEVRRAVGTFDVLPDQLDFAIPSGLREHLDYQEQSLLFTANQLVDAEWSFGARYRISQAVLRDNFVDVPDGLIFGNFQPRQRLEGVMHHLSLFAIFNHPCGFFGEGEARWYTQENQGYTPKEPGDDFWQFNAFAGYRFPRRKAEVALGLLNITDQDYRLNPLNVYNELPRERTLMVRLRLNF